jgi:type IV pilus assembly protein PilO
MTGTELIERFSKVPPAHKAAGLVLISVFFGVGFYFMLFSEVMDSSDSLSNRITGLEQEKVQYEEKQRKYNSLRAEVNKLLKEQEELAKVLPTDAEIPSFLKSIHAKGELAGLNILTFEQQPEVKENFYAMIPVKMSISGNFHQIIKFFYTVGNLKRIVNIKDLQLLTPQITETGILLQANFITSTFRFISAQPEATAKPQGSQG